MHVTKIVTLLSCFLLCVCGMNFWHVKAHELSFTTTLSYTRILLVSLKEGNPLSPDDAVKTELDGGSVAEDLMTGKQYWKLNQDDSIDFSFALPEGVQKIEVRIQCISDADVVGKARIRWNSRTLQNEEGETRTLDFNGANFSETLPLTEPDDQNILRILVTEGTIGIQEVQLRCEIAYPETSISVQPAQQIFENIVEQGKNVLKEEIQNKINDNFPPQTVPLINSVISGNFEQRKAQAIRAIATQVSDTTGLSQSAVQRILSSRNEQELKNNIVLTSQEHTLNPSTVMYAMDYIL